MNRTRKIVTTAAAAVLATSGIVFATSAEAATAVVQITFIQYDSPGTDNRSNSSLVAEYVRVTNKSNQRLNLEKWTLRDAANHVFTFPKHSFGPGGTVYIHTGKGTNGKQPNGTPDSARLYQQRGAYVWNNDKDTATLKSASGRTYDTCSWQRTGTGKTSC